MNAWIVGIYILYIKFIQSLQGVSTSRNGQIYIFGKHKTSVSGNGFRDEIGVKYIYSWACIISVAYQLASVGVTTTANVNDTNMPSER